MRSFIVAEDGLPHLKEHHSTASAEGWVVTQTRLNKAQGGCVLPTWAKYVGRDADGSWWAYECEPRLGPAGVYQWREGETLELYQTHGVCVSEFFNLE